MLLNDGAVLSPTPSPQTIPVFSEIRVENTNYCGYKCFICPHDRMTREKGVMSAEDLLWVIRRVGIFKGRVDLHNFGEPLLDPGLRDKIALISKAWPEAVVRIFSTLGLRVRPGYWRELLDAGLDHLEVSLYGWSRESYLGVHGVDMFDVALENLRCLMGEIKAGGFKTPVILRKFPVHGSVRAAHSQQDQAAIQAFYDMVGQWGVRIAPDRALHNYGGGRAYNPPGETPCSIIWGYRRRILQITWRLEVIPCCFDFDASVIWGDLKRQTLEEIFNGPVYREFVTAHKNNELKRFPVCINCDHCQMK